MSLSEERIAHNNATFRAANERIRKSAETYDLAAGALPSICECADARCTTVLEVPLATYAEVRAHARRFLIADRDHVPIEGDGRVIEEADGYIVFEKTGRAGELLEGR